ncbi:hypothetical protein B0H17DRAFT_1283343 [Mycena rosella]|uniref:Uncharacterized protein n=1 Tax=Mycena rosella TaxID=1033263 RepID=A0AAD7BV45_MYCRO|nr:hypothetical protein B0H17DRAFT_1283343 [Mycena rosella]
MRGKCRQADAVCIAPSGAGDRVRYPTDVYGEPLGCRADADADAEELRASCGNAQTDEAGRERQRRPSELGYPRGLQCARLHARILRVATEFSCSVSLGRRAGKWRWRKRTEELSCVRAAETRARTLRGAARSSDVGVSRSRRLAPIPPRYLHGRRGVQLLSADGVDDPQRPTTHAMQWKPSADSVPNSTFTGRNRIRSVAAL